MSTKRSSCISAATCAALVMILGVPCATPVEAPVDSPRFEVDPFWPKPLPDRWVTGDVAFVCVGPRDHVFILNRRNLSDHELDAGQQAPAVIEFDPEGYVVNAWGDPNVLPAGALHGFFVDHEGNVWIAGEEGTILQKWSHDGSKLLLQIGSRGVADWSQGAAKGKSWDSSQTLIFAVQDVFVDPKNDDIYVANSGNHGVVVFDRNGQFLRQWALENTKPAKAEGEPPDETRRFSPHCIMLSNDDLVYVCDRLGDQAQVFDKMGKFQKSINIDFEQRSKSPKRPGHHAAGWSTVMHLAFSPDPAQKFLYVANSADQQVDILDRASGRILSTFGRAGHQLGEFADTHTLAADSKGNIYVAEGWHNVGAGRRIQKFRVVSGQ